MKTIVIKNAQTGDVIEREMTAEEVVMFGLSDEALAASEALWRISELKRFLEETDYVALSDYDKDKPEILAQRAEWRAEIRRLETEQEPTD